MEVAHRHKCCLGELVSVAAQLALAAKVASKKNVRTAVQPAAADSGVVC